MCLCNMAVLSKEQNKGAVRRNCVFTLKMLIPCEYSSSYLFSWILVEVSMRSGTSTGSQELLQDSIIDHNLSINKLDLSSQLARKRY